LNSSLFPCRTNPEEQFQEFNVMRELNKAYCAFMQKSSSDEKPVATGNWGCGVFNGNPELKFLIQLMAASQAGRCMYYFTFGDKRQSDSIAEIIHHLKHHAINVGMLFRLVQDYSKDEMSKGRYHKPMSLFKYIYSSGASKHRVRRTLTT